MKRKIPYEGNFEEFILKKRLLSSNAYVVLLQGRRMETRGSMYNELEAALQLPSYFGRNWNALDECLADFSWLPQQKIIVAINEFERVLASHEFGLQRREGELGIFRDCLQDAVEELAGRLTVYIQENGNIFQLRADCPSIDTRDEDFRCFDQMHDEQIDGIRMDEDALVLSFSRLHFPHGKQYDRAELIFSGFEEMTSDVYIEIFDRTNCIITSGKRFYIDEFIPYMGSNNMALEVIDILHGLEEIFIRGKVIDSSNSYGKNFNLSISAKNVTYRFF